MKPCAFEYHCPETLDHALQLLNEHGDEAKILAGGQSLVPAMNFRLAQPGVLIDLNKVQELTAIEEHGSFLRIGTMVRQRTVERSTKVAEHLPLVAETMPHVAHPQIRNRGTLGGSIAHADPSGELPAVALTLEAVMQVRSVRCAREIAADDFFVDLLTTALEADEILVAVDFPKAGNGSGYAFDEVCRRHGDFALVGVAAAVHCEAEVCRSARVSMLSVGTGPVLSNGCTELLADVAPTIERIKKAAQVAGGEDIDPEGDIHATAAYRRHLAKVLVEKTLIRAFSKAGVEVK